MSATPRLRETLVTESALAPPLAARAHAAARARLRSADALFLAASGLIAVHVLDDSFVQPEAGTSARDHLVSGLVPLALVALAVAAYPRLRAGLRAVVALILGFFGTLIGATEAGYYTFTAGPARDDFTGLAAVAAGLVLLGLGAVALWTSRRRSGSRLRNYARRAVIALVGAVVAYHLLGLAFAYGFTHAARPAVPEARLGAPYEDVSFTTSDGLKLRGWYVRSTNGAAVIAYPGRKNPQKHARMLARHGYGVLLFDRRGEGQSEGDPDGLGWVGDRDVNAAVAFLQGRDDVDRDRIGGIGLSTGGEVLLQTAARSPGLKAVVSEGAGIRSLREELELPGAMKWGLLAQWSISTAATAVFSNHNPPPSLTELVARIAPRPVFLIYATHGQGGEQELNPVYYAAAREPKQLWGIPGSAHMGGISARPAEYERRVVGFFDDALLNRRHS